MTNPLTDDTMNGLQFLAFSEAITTLAGDLTEPALVTAIRSLRGPGDPDGVTGRWAGLPPHLTERRVQLQQDLVRRWEGLAREPWPFLKDRLSEVVPDDLSGL